MSDPKKVFDLDAAIAEEGDLQPFTFRFGGEDYTLSPELNMFAIAAITSGVESDLKEGLRLLFGVEQYARLETSPSVFGPTALELFLQAYAEHCGLDLGEVLASSAPSNRAARRSKQTSNGSTASRSRPSARAS